MRNKLAWEREITDILIVRLDISDGDAQGLLDVREPKLKTEWKKGSSAETVAEIIISQGN